MRRVLALRGETAEAIEIARFCRDEMQRDHAFGQIASRVAEATALVLDGRFADAEAVALESLELIQAMDMLDLHGDVLVLLADIDVASGRPGAAAARVTRATELYEQKGDIVSAARARERS